MQRIRELRKALEELRHDKEVTDIKANRVKELEEEVLDLRQREKSLESKIARLCETPFINQAFGMQDIEELTRERDDLKQKTDHLQEAVRTHYSALVSLKDQAGKLRQEKEAAENEVIELKAKYHELELGTNILNDKLRLFSGDDGVSMEELERALTVVKRRGEAAVRLDFLEDIDGGEGESMLTIPALKRKLQNVQVLNLNLTKEVERLENMLRLQTGINRDLHHELESIVHKRDKDKKELIQRAEDFEDMASKRLEKIHSLEAQVRQLVYGVSKAGGAGAGAGGIPKKGDTDGYILDTSTIASEVDTNALLNDLIEERGGEVGPDDNLLEVWVKGASIRQGVLGPGTSSFVVIDFFDYESQTTTLLSGSAPQWDFAATFKIVVDDFLLRYLATDVVTFELNMVRYRYYCNLIN